MACVFDIHSDRAMFRKPYTTTSSVSYPFPPPTTVAGIVSAILGFANKSNETIGNAAYWEKMSGTQIAIKINTPIKWEIQTVNFLTTKQSQTGRVQIKHHYVKKPSYRIYLRGELEESLCRSLKKHQYTYTPYLGVAYALANITFIGQFPEKICNTTTVDTTFPITDPEGPLEPAMVKNNSLNKTEVPFEFSPKRDLKKVLDVLYKNTANPLHFKIPPKDLVLINDENVKFFPSW